MTAAIHAPLQPRRDNDAYYTPDALAHACIGAIACPTPRLVVEPSVGGGAFARAVHIRWAAAFVTGVDINPDAPGFTSCDHAVHAPWSHDTAEDIRLSAGARVDMIVGNPPYQGAEEHVLVALDAAPVVGMLLRLGWLAGQKRRSTIWNRHPPAAVHVLSRRPSFTGGGTDASEYAFYVWDRARYDGDTFLTWLDW